MLFFLFDIFVSDATMTLEASLGPHLTGFRSESCEECPKRLVCGTLLCAFARQLGLESLPVTETHTSPRPCCPVFFPHPASYSGTVVRRKPLSADSGMSPENNYGRPRLHAWKNRWQSPNVIILSGCPTGLSYSRGSHQNLHLIPQNSAGCNAESQTPASKPVSLANPRPGLQVAATPCTSAWSSHFYIFSCKGSSHIA